jgi:ElaB/YqjD/DUF883 family membrane-anchored ribosome-binding protein
MKLTLTTLSIICMLLAAYWFMNVSDSGNEKKIEDVSVVDSSHKISEKSEGVVKLGKIANGEPLPQDNTMLAENEELVIYSQEQARQRLDTMKTKIDTLVRKYEDNMKDPEARAKVKLEMEAMIKEYDQFALQVAMEKMRNG